MFYAINVGVLFRFGQEAVILFFLLSGFVVNYSFRRSPDKTFHYYFIRRALRIYVPLIIVMACSWIFEGIRAGRLVNPDAETLLLNLLMLQDVRELKPGVLADPYMGNTPLWSLSYEWWFYMLYFPIQKFISREANRDAFVYVVAVSAALVYAYQPSFVPRVLMYLSIWWLGVVISNAYIAGLQVRLAGLQNALIGLGIVCLINTAVVAKSALSGELSGVGVRPVLELRHHLFALLVVMMGTLWYARQPALLDSVLKPFAVLAPVSYVVYISHHYFIVAAGEMSAIVGEALSLLCVMSAMIAFAYVVEVGVFPAVQRWILRAVAR